jgi:excisionase family DNA binding protein
MSLVVWEIVSMPINYQQKYLSQTQAAQYVGCSISTIQKLIRLKMLVHKRFGRRIFIAVEDLEATLRKFDRKLPRIHDHSGTRKERPRLTSRTGRELVEQ